MRKHFIKIIISLLFIFICQSSIYAVKNSSNFTSSNLPIIIINTNGLAIPYNNPRIVADMDIKYNEQGENIEIKAKAVDFNRQKKIAETLSDIPAEQIWQEDIFFKISKGRLKLRIFDCRSGELIYYMRTDSSGPKVSKYEISVTNEPESLKNILKSSLGVRGVIKKQRTLYKIGFTRIHFDQVEDLGNFIELEFVMQDNSSKNEALQTVRNLMEKLEIQDKHLINKAYIDMVSE